MNVPGEDAGVFDHRCRGCSHCRPGGSRAVDDLVAAHDAERARLTGELAEARGACAANEKRANGWRAEFEAARAERDALRASLADGIGAAVTAANVEIAALRIELDQAIADWNAATASAVWVGGTSNAEVAALRRELADRIAAARRIMLRIQGVLPSDVCWYCNRLIIHCDDDEEVPVSDPMSCAGRQVRAFLTPAVAPVLTKETR